MAHTITRVTWFCLIGWWLAILWLSVAFLLMLTFIGWPIAYKMFDSAKWIATLE